MIEKYRIALIVSGIVFIIMGVIVTNDNVINFILQGLYVLGIILLVFGIMDIKKYQNEDYQKPDSIKTKYVKSAVLITLFAFILLTIYFKIPELFILMFFMVAVFLFLATKAYSKNIRDSNELEIYINTKSMILGLQIFLVVIFLTSLSFVFYFTWISQTDIGSSILVVIYLITGLLLIIEFIKIILIKMYQ